MRSWIGGHDPGSRMSLRTFSNGFVDNRSSVIPESGDFANNEDHVGRESCNEHGHANAEVMSHCANCLERFGIALAGKSQDIVETRF